MADKPNNLMLTIAAIRIFSILSRFHLPICTKNRPTFSTLILNAEPKSMLADPFTIPFEYSPSPSTCSFSQAEYQRERYCKSFIKKKSTNLWVKMKL